MNSVYAEPISAAESEWCPPTCYSFYCLYDCFNSPSWLIFTTDSPVERFAFDLTINEWFTFSLWTVEVDPKSNEAEVKMFNLEETRPSFAALDALCYFQANSN